MLLSVAAISFADCLNRNANIELTKPNAIYVDHGNGTITDTETKLMWSKCLEGVSGANCSAGSATFYTWQAALAKANDAMTSTAGYTDWRLPNIKELKSLVDRACFDPAINQTAFPNTTYNALLWSATPSVRQDFEAWGLFMQRGDIGGDAKTRAMMVRLVRDAP